MRKFMSAFMALVLTLVSFGGFSQVQAQEPQTFEIGVAIYQYNDNFMTLYREELGNYFTELGEADGNTYNVDFQDGQNNQATQTEQLNNFIAQGKDLIIANLVDPTGAEQIILSAQSADIPVIFINREPDISTMELWPGKTTYVGVDARQSGVFQGEIIADLDNHGDLNGDGVVSYLMIMGDAGNVDAEQRTQYSIETLEQTIPTASLGEHQRGNWDQARGQEIAANALSQYGEDLEVIFSNNDGMALGAVQAIDGAGRVINEDIYIVGVDALPEVVELITAGNFTGTVLNDHFNQARTAAEVAVRLLNGEEVAPYFWHDYVKVTSAEEAELKRLDFNEETIEEYQQRLEETYGSAE
ncbi:galactose ABC transporter substrate-binding protein [Fundicoccus culcitae]|uniref:D-galactose/methyl-galactoside binding periplasmic protein MglB n=1 Tax=Fundicoccus culcitae TaxID=2969821 RepID=A0ABY5P3X9_9LACT|nr:galactose ABC transporter substrate-binding protein [Fundicoccus culcitae]UUX33446.1 galactose ABC transporter substrate-binding protein [Fundicoccus culcitae]